MIYKHLVTNKIIKDRNIYSILIFSISHWMVSYAYFGEPILLKKDCINLYNNFSYL